MRAEDFDSVSGKGNAFALIFNEAVKSVKYKEFAGNTFRNYFWNRQTQKIKYAESQK